MVIEPFVANVHNIMYWIVIVLQYNTDITDICKKIEKKIIFFKSYEIIRTHIFKVILSRLKVYVN